MKIETFIEDCRELGILLYLKDGELGYRAQKGSMTQDILSAIRDQKNNILKHLRSVDEANRRFQIESTSKDCRKNGGSGLLTDGRDFF